MVTEKNKEVEGIHDGRELVLWMLVKVLIIDFFYKNGVRK